MTTAQDVLSGRAAWAVECGDCLKLLPTLPAGSFDAVIADPPWGTTACKWDSVIPLEPMWRHLRRVLRPGGAVVLIAGQPFTTTLIGSNREDFRYCWVWDKHMASGHLSVQQRPLLAHGDIVVFGGNTYNPQLAPRTRPELSRLAHRQVRSPGGPDCYRESAYRANQTRTAGTFKYPSSVLRIPAVMGGSREKRSGAHPTQKPVALMEYLVRTYTNEDDTVLDFCAGSGTTGVAALRAGRRFVGVELGLGYCETARRRLSEVDGPLFAAVPFAGMAAPAPGLFDTPAVEG